MFPRWFKEIPMIWPIAASVVGIVVTAASADTRLNDLTDKVGYIWVHGTPAEMPTLARIDERQAQEAKTLERIDSKLDRLEEARNAR